MTAYKFEVTSVSGSIDYHLDPSFGSEPHEVFDFFFTMMVPLMLPIMHVHVLNPAQALPLKTALLLA